MNGNMIFKLYGVLMYDKIKYFKSDYIDCNIRGISDNNFFTNVFSIFGGCNICIQVIAFCLKDYFCILKSCIITKFYFIKVFPY